MCIRDRECLLPAGFGKITVTTASEHDRMIAFTSQMAHIVSNAFIKSPTAGSHKGFSAGSYKDLTRVAWLNPDMWTELFLENKENLVYELDILINSLSEYRMIAFTSQMAHIVSNAFIKSPTAGSHKGFSAGSYKDLTRVAWLNPDMWTELFLENKENLVYELDILINSLSEYRKAIKNGDAETLHRILDDGRKKKEEVDGAR